jgi:dolichyl-phosphate beta-glucosyltransferase
MSAPRLSVVIPAFNEKARLPQTLRRIDEYLRGRQATFEIVVVDDGSRDGTADVARATLGDAVTVLVNDRNRGKGYSVRRGMLAARGERRLMSDADLSTPIEELERLERKLGEGLDVVIASRSVPGANVEVHQPALREALGRLFNRVVRLLTLPGLRDTQCGFKLFSAEAAEEAFSRARLPGFSFDVEVLYIALRRGRRIAELPVTWRNDAATRVTLLRGMAAFLDVVRIRVLGALGAYDD